ncbi:MAG: hypothetical protein DLM53_11355 [Candidatus Eremiobacter antarcticus]|nr:MAG: hypothetical protein DLM53_11355 [Candidatus Eremiobacter sp. RRmetagenome_bin22]
MVLAANAPMIESTPAPAAPKPDFSKSMFLLGNWTCSTKSSRRPAAFITTSTTTIDPTGYWMITKGVQHKTSWTRTDFKGVDMTTYDADARRWVDISTGDEGSYNLSTSPGWRGNSIVWTDAVISPQGNVMSTTPTTLTKMSDTKMSSHSTFKEHSGRMVTVDSACHKTG